MPSGTFRLTAIFTFLLLLLLVFPQRSLTQAPAAAPSKDPAADLLKQGAISLELHQYAEAAKEYKKASQLRRDACSECLLGLAMAEYRLGQSDDAVKACDKAIACAANDTEREASHSLKGSVLQSGSPNAKKLKDAEDEFRTALQLRPQLASNHLNLGVVLLRESQQDAGISELNDFLQLNPSADSARYARKLILDPKAAGEPLAAAFKVRTLAGDDFSLDDLSGKIVVMDFWATWCPPCVESVPEIKELTKKYPASQLALISVSADDKEEPWKDFIAKKGMDWPQYWDGDGKIRRTFGVHAFPTYLVIDQQGFIRERIEGLDSQKSIVYRLKDTLKTLLPE